MARSLSPLVNMNAEMVKTMSMILTSHPLFITVANHIFRIINLLDYLSTKGVNNLLHRTVKMMSYLWEYLNGCWQSTILMALRYAIAEKMKTLSEALKKQLAKEAVKGYPKVRLIGKFALYSAIFLLQDTELISTFDKDRSKTIMLLIICLILLSFSEVIFNRFGVVRMRAGWKVNSISNLTCFILALVFEQFYEKSWRSLSAGFCFAVYFLSLLIILRPLTDFGIFGLIMAAIGSVAYNCYGFKFPTWGIACICFLLFSFKSWLDKYWFDLEEDPSLPSTTHIGTVGMFLSFPCSILYVGYTLSVASISSSSAFSLGLVVEHKDHLLLDVIDRFGPVFNVLFSCLFWFWKRVGVQILAKDHLPLYTGVNVKTRQAFWWFKLYLLLDLLFYLSVISRILTLKEVLSAVIVWTSCSVLLRFWRVYLRFFSTIIM